MPAVTLCLSVLQVFIEKGQNIKIGKKTAQMIDEIKKIKVIRSV